MLIKKPQETVILMLLLLLTLNSFACGRRTSLALKATLSTPQGVESTHTIRTKTNQLVKSQTLVTPELGKATLTLKPTQPYQDIGYYDGIIVITQYYTFLGHGLYEEAYRLLSHSAQAYSLDEYVNLNKNAYKVVSIISIQPYYIWAEQQGYKVNPDPENKKRFYVAIYAEGEGGWSGSAPNGKQFFFVTMILDNLEWKLDSWATIATPL
jgi:hypothetical protein